MLRAVALGVLCPEERLS